MVRFEGTLSDECVLYRAKFSDRVLIVGMLCVLALGIIIVSMVALFGHVDDDMMKETLLWMGILAVVLLITVFCYFKRKKPRVNVNIEMFVDSDNIEYTVGAFKTEKISVNRVKKVYKIGQRYYIIRKFGDISSSLMAEEALLKEGTIEEFEALFGDKLVVKTK